MSHIHSYRIVDIILVRTILVSVGRLCDKRKIISVFTKIIHLPLEILLLVIPVSYRCICQPGFIQFILSLQVEYIFLFSWTNSGELLFFRFLIIYFQLTNQVCRKIFECRLFISGEKSFAIYIDFTDGLSVVCQRIIFLIIYQSGNTLH